MQVDLACPLGILHDPCKLSRGNYVVTVFALIAPQQSGGTIIYSSIRDLVAALLERLNSDQRMTRFNA